MKIITPLIIFVWLLNVVGQVPCNSCCEYKGGADPKRSYKYKREKTCMRYYKCAISKCGRLRDANFSICQVVMIAEGNRRMPKAFVGGGYGRGASPLSLWGGLGVLHQDFLKSYMLFGAFWSNLSTNLKPYGYMIFHNKIQIFLHCPHIYMYQQTYIEISWTCSDRNYGLPNRNSVILS